MNRFKFFKIFCFILSVAAALYYPVQKIIRYEYRPARTFEFKVTGYDPYDPARGHYLALTVHPQKSNVKKDGLYAVIGTDKDGYADVIDLIDKPDGRPCVKLKYSSGNRRIHYKFNRFYINEKLARRADSIFRMAVEAKKRCVLAVRVYDDGACAVSDLLIDGKSIRILAAECGVAKK